MKLKIIGLNIVKYVGESVSGHNMDFTYEEAVFTGHDLYGMSKSGEFFRVSLREEEGICGSGWSTASFGKISVEKISVLPGLQYRCQYKDMIEVPKPGIESSEDEIHNGVFWFSELGTDPYYPSGGYGVHMNQFSSNGRGITSPEDIRRKVWIFKGDSGAGKSFLASKLDSLSVFETDAHNELPKTISEDVIVLGNKYDYSLENVKAKIFEADSTDIVVVDFSS